MKGLHESRILVTGGTSGIGEEIVERLRSERARVVFTGRSVGRGEAIVERTGAHFIEADVRDAAAVSASVDEAVLLLGGLTAQALFQFTMQTFSRPARCAQTPPL
ncbi:MAG: SDR family NAD(P)-dependent oxidoreductase [Gaiellales bacterium]